MVNKIRDWLYIGDYHDAQDYETLAKNKIGAVLELAGPVNHPGIVSQYIWVQDAMPLPENKLRRGLEFILENKDRGVFVGCAAGVSRSATFCIAALVEVEGLSLKTAYDEVKKARQVINPHFTLWASLRNYYRE
jgi:hypothetical protein